MSKLVASLLIAALIALPARLAVASVCECCEPASTEQHDNATPTGCCQSIETAPDEPSDERRPMPCQDDDCSRTCCKVPTHNPAWLQASTTGKSERSIATPRAEHGVINGAAHLDRLRRPPRPVIAA